MRAFPAAAGQWQVSTKGGSQPRWRRDGKEVFYVAPDQRLMAVPMAIGKDLQTVEAGAPVALFATRLATGGSIFTGPGVRPQYAVTADGRFLMNIKADQTAALPITIVLNWDAAMRN